MKSQGHAAIRTGARFAAPAAQQRCGKATAIEKQNGLLAFFQARDDRAVQFLTQDRERFRFARFLAQIDHANERHLIVIDALR